MWLTKEEADNALRAAIIDHAVAYEIVRPEEMLLSEYAIVSAWQEVEQASGARTFYMTQFHAPYVPTHSALGLFHTGVKLLLEDDD